MHEDSAQIEERKAVAVVGAVCSLSQADAGARIMQLEALMMEHPQVEIPVTHRFNGGMYAREITIPKGTLLTGRIHKFDHFDIMLSGDIFVSSDGGVKHLSGLNIMEGKAGKKRAGYAHEDTHWITFHSAEERDPEDMYEFLTVETFEDLEAFNFALASAMADFEESERVLTEHAEEVLCQS